MRDTRRDETYFKDLIVWEVGSAKGAALKLTSEELKEELQIGLSSSISFSLMKLLKSMYSYGYDIKKMSLLYPYILYFTDYYTNSEDYNYDHFIELISYGVCFNSSLEIMSPIKSIADKGKGCIHDGLSDRYLVNCGLGSSILKEKVNWNPYKHLLPVFLTEDKAERVEGINLYLKKWYSSFRRNGTFNDNQLLEGISYVGYWCIEAAGLVKLFELDDKLIMESPFYPYDLAHYDILWSNEEAVRAYDIYHTDIVYVAQKLIELLNILFPDISPLS